MFLKQSKYLWMFFVIVFYQSACEESLNKKHGSADNNLQVVSSEVNTVEDIPSEESLSDTSTSTSTETCPHPAVSVNSNCYTNFNAITSATECEIAGGYSTGATSGVTCYQSVSVVPQAVCTSLKFVFSNGICYPSSTAETNASNCFTAKQIYINTSTASTGCVTDYSHITSQSECNAALSSAKATSPALWLPVSKVCLQNVSFIKTAAECAELNGSWVRNSRCKFPKHRSVRVKVRKRFERKDKD